ncbi:MAG: hypothetical protein IT579_23220, partial [Verrucomicrobia subdivision 3 bacterium]|nr:hypothetical protein [Limisphaerales bacterium]
MRPTNPVQTPKTRWQMGQRVGALTAVFQLALTSGGFGATPGFVEAAVKPGERWTRHPVRLVADLPAALVSQIDTNLSPYGGLRARRQPATGFFYPAKISDRWWLVDPEGCLF